MSAIKINRLKMLFSTFLLLIFFSCKKEVEKASEKSNKITFISISMVGGKLGHYKIIKVSKDSIKLTQGISTKNIHKQWNSAINPETWKKLTSTIDPKTLGKIKSSESIQPIDGADESFQIKTSQKSYFYLNSYNDTLYYKQLQAFKDQVDKILPKEYQ
ncbi:hypothetical protein [Chryseobacterium sp. ERMR1:04]|uniref:hypothetical protein n=1 Tax=Chryseobacterium sp. ERMR1:04 TaxID=1705393 RepID=UPI0006C890F1|nr:hypothetical protein [Chryseobacterium sp. ERMR1:04]KPH12619.1 hypothetical protein AMQ68_17185 [Chryseobacterium sp. ERMR1:04]